MANLIPSSKSKFLRYWLYEVYLGTRKKPTQFWGSCFSRKEALELLTEECKGKGFVIRRSSKAPLLDTYAKVK